MQGKGAGAVAKGGSGKGQDGLANRKHGLGAGMHHVGNHHGAHGGAGLGKSVGKAGTGKGHNQPTRRASQIGHIGSKHGAAHHAPGGQHHAAPTGHHASAGGGHGKK
jgi:hypothetical protein